MRAHRLVCNVSYPLLQVKKSDVNFLWAQFTELNAYLSQRAQNPREYTAYMAEVAALKTCMKGEGENDHGEIVDVPISADLEALLRRLNDRIQTLYEALPSNTMLIVLTGLGDTSTVRR